MSSELPGAWVWGAPHPDSSFQLHMIFSSNRPTPGLSSLWSPHGSQEQWEKVNPNARATCQVAHVFFFFWPCHVTHGIFISPPRIEPVPLALGAQSFDPWTTRGFPTHLFLSCYWPKQITWLLLMQRVETETLEVFRAILYSLLCFTSVNMKAAFVIPFPMVLL